MCTMLAPASYARLASSAISTGVYGIAGQCFLVVTAPVSAHERMTLSAWLIARGSRSARALSRREREAGDVLQALDHAAARRGGHEIAFVRGRARVGDQADLRAERHRHREIELEDVADHGEIAPVGARLVEQRAELVVIAAAAREHGSLQS